MTLDTSQTWRYIVNPKTVTYHVKSSRTGHEDGEEVTHCLERARVKSDLLKKLTLVLHAWKEKLGAIVPKRGDALITDDGKRWTVHEVGVQSHGQRFRLELIEE